MDSEQTPPDWAFDRACGLVGLKPHHVRAIELWIEGFGK